MIRLEMSFGIIGTALQWLRSYLSCRSQHVIVNGKQSESLNLPFGVPQGSCLGPLLFTFYHSSKLFEVIKPHLPEAHAYADDCLLYLSFEPNLMKRINRKPLSQWSFVSERLDVNLNLMMIKQNL